MTKLIFESDEHEKAFVDDMDESVVFRANGRIDIDGSGPSHGDPCYQADTTLHLDGKPLNSDVDKYIVLPPTIVKAVPGIMLGCQALVLNIKNGRQTHAVVGDIGPSRKLGELSAACALALGISPNPNIGGTDDFILNYTVWPGVAAVVDGKQYQLQHYRG